MLGFNYQVALLVWLTSNRDPQKVNKHIANRKNFEFYQNFLTFGGYEMSREQIKNWAENSDQILNIFESNQVTLFCALSL